MYTAEKKYKPPKHKPTKKEKKVCKTNITTPEMIFEELVKNNMINKSVFSEFSEFKGEISYSSSVLRGEPYNSDPPYGLGDVRQVRLHKLTTTSFRVLSSISLDYL